MLTVIQYITQKYFIPHITCDILQGNYKNVDGKTYPISFKMLKKLHG